MILDWLEENVGCGPLVALVIVLLVGALAWVLHKDNQREKAACARAWAIARTSTDSIAVIRMCEVKDEKVYIPQPIYIPSR